MKGTIKSFLAVLIAAAMCCATLSGCFGDCFGGDTTPKEYTLQYTDDSGTHQITVTGGEPYSIESVPQRDGYEFLGLFNAETGGKQYVSAQGASLSVYSDKKNLVLFPQWKAKQYSLVLDYQGAESSGARSFTVEYGSNLPALPLDLHLEHKVFCGWYTKENCGGLQVADKNGLVPVVSVVNKDNFILSQDSTRINLYAGFTTATYSVTLNFGSGLGTETIKAPYGTNVKDLVYDTRNVNGEAVYKWSSKSDLSDEFYGSVEGELMLYAKVWANAVNFNTDGGKKLAPVVAATGANITLPEPEKDLCKFLYWEYNGQRYTATTMPSTSITLKAVWQAKIALDENGGSGVDDISVLAGNSITLPTPVKEGFIFAGWYKKDKELYTSTTMPSTGVALTAGWYKAEQKTVTLVDNNLDKKIVVDSNTLSKNQRLKVDLSDMFPKIPTGGVEISYKINFQWGNTYQNCSANGKIALYDGDDLNSNNQLAIKTLSHSDDCTSYIKDSLSGVSKIQSNVLYLYYSGAGKLHISLTGGYGDDVAFYDINIELTYPDTSTLYL